MNTSKITQVLYNTCVVSVKKKAFPRYGLCEANLSLSPTTDPETAYDYRRVFFLFFCFVVANLSFLGNNFYYHFFNFSKTLFSIVYHKGNMFHPSWSICKRKNVLRSRVKGVFYGWACVVFLTIKDGAN